MILRVEVRDDSVLTYQTSEASVLDLEVEVEVNLDALL